MVKYRFAILLLLIVMLIQQSNVQVHTGNQVTLDNNASPAFNINAIDDMYENDDSFETAGTIILNTIQDRSVMRMSLSAESE